MANGEVKSCSARGNLKLKSDGIIVGDYVKIENDVITAVEKRKNSLIRPKVANVDAVNIVVGNPPKVDLFMLDKILVACNINKLEVFITVNKNDNQDDTFQEIVSNYSSCVKNIISVSAKTGDGFDKLKELLNNKFVAFAGQSAVGKTTIINRLFDIEKSTSEVSLKTQRGRHTTTYSEIHVADGLKVIDTPGFSAYFNDIDQDNLKDYYSDYKEASNECYYIGCKHLKEPDCKVKSLIEQNIYSKDRYNRYLQMIEEIKNKGSKKKNGKY